MSPEPESLSDELVDTVADRVLERLEEQADPATATYTTREILEGVAVLGTGLAVGGISTYGAVGRAAASHGGGSIGTSSDRVDLFAQDVDATNATISSAPSSSDDVARKQELDGKVGDATTTGNAPYEIQKDGTDGTGVINFKTS